MSEGSVPSNLPSILRSVSIVDADEEDQNIQKRTEEIRRTPHKFVDLPYDESKADLVVPEEEVSLRDPWLMTRIREPVKGTNCKRHLNCWDKQIAIRRQEKICPFCAKPFTPQDMVDDVWFKKLLSETSPNCIKVKYHSNNRIEEIEHESTGVEDTSEDRL